MIIMTIPGHLVVLYIDTWTLLIFNIVVILAWIISSFFFVGCHPPPIGNLVVYGLLNSLRPTMQLLYQVRHLAAVASQPKSHVASV